MRAYILLRRRNIGKTGRLAEPRRTGNMAQRALTAVSVLISMLLGMAVRIMGIAMARVRIRMAAMMRLRGLWGDRGIAKILLANDHSRRGTGIKRQPQHHDDQQNFSSHLSSVAINPRQRKARRV